jgi:hypothetical protein
MALPFSRDETAIPGTTQVKSSIWNKLQDYIVYMFTGGRSVNGLIIDGVGDVAPGLPPKSHLIISGLSPTLAAGAGVGTSPTLAVAVGSDCIGQINITCGTSPTAGQKLATVSFHDPMGRAIVSLSPANGLAAKLTGDSIVIASPNVTGGSWDLIYAGATGVLTAGQTYSWFYTAFGTTQ